MELDYRATFYQISLGVKILIAQLINSMVLTFIAAYFIKKNIYKPGGLADDVFYFGISNAFVSFGEIHQFILFVQAYIQMVLVETW